jgi:hypothetical protein
VLLRAEEAAAELCERVEDEVRRVVLEATLHRSVYTVYRERLQVEVRVVVEANATTNTEVGRVEARLRELDMPSLTMYVSYYYIYVGGS